MRMAMMLAVVATLVACFPTSAGRPIDYDAVRRLRVGETTPDDAVRELGPPYIKSATAPDEIMYGWTYWHYGARTSESVFLRFRNGRLVDYPGTHPVAAPDPSMVASAR